MLSQEFINEVKERNDITDVTCKHLCCVKGNYLAADYKSESIKLRFSEHLTFKETLLLLRLSGRR